MHVGAANKIASVDIYDFLSTAVQAIYLLFTLCKIELLF